MAVTPAPVRQVEFLLDRLTAADGRITVEGRWYGVVGRRFLRPNLQIEGRRRLIARLEHKPWAADDGAPWCAAFDYDGPVGASLLQVAPDIAIELPPPGGPLVDERRRPRVAMAPPVDPVQREETELERIREVLDRVRDERDEARAEAARLRDERDMALEDVARAESSLERAREEADQLREREKRALANAEIFRRERDAARLQTTRADEGGSVIGALPTGERPPIFSMSRRRTFYGPRIAAGLGALAALLAVVWIL